MCADSISVKFNSFHIRFSDVRFEIIKNSRKLIDSFLWVLIVFCQLNNLIFLDQLIHYFRFIYQYYHFLKNNFQDLRTESEKYKLVNSKHFECRPWFTYVTIIHKGNVIGLRQQRPPVLSGGREGGGAVQCVGRLRRAALTVRVVRVKVTAPGQGAGLGLGHRVRVMLMVSVSIRVRLRVRVWTPPGV